MIRLLLDQGVPRSAVILLHALDIDASTASDAEILTMGRQEQRTVVTLDADFHALLALSSASTPSVIRIRLQGLRAEALTDIICKVLDRCLDDVLAGAAISVTETKIRIRRLPLT